jgi:N-methylhydantoinase A
VGTEVRERELTASGTPQGSGSLQVGIDIGGTFSDVFIFDEESGELRTGKTWSVTEDPSAVVEIFDQIDVDVSKLALFTHAATVGINAIVTRRGVPTGMLCTHGHRDILDMGRGLRKPGQIWDFNLLRPHLARPLIPREWRRPIVERVVHDGTVLVELDEDQVMREARWLAEQGVESIAVAYLNSYLNPTHERRTAELIEAELPDLDVFTSTDLLPAFREVPRTTAVAINAYVSPIVDRYIEQLDQRLDARGFGGTFTVMKADGGFATKDGIHKRGVDTLHSGPVAGVSAARSLGSAIGVEDLLIIDMGGTTADVSIVTAGQSPTTNEFEAEPDLLVGVPVVEVQSIGAGGGSIASIDAGGALQVGPASAGSTPGPACYGRGGELPTVTDAHVVRGTLSPDHFLGGTVPLDVERARAAVATLAGPLGISTEEAAQGIVEIVEINMAGALRNMSIYRGHDPRDYALLPVGAAGPMHGSALGRELGVREVIVPPWPGEFSAFGLLASDHRVEMTHAVVRNLASIEPGEMNRIFADLEQRALAYLERQNVSAKTIEFTHFFDGMYLGQSWDTRCEVPPGELGDGATAELSERFEVAYELAWGSRLGMPVKVSSFGVTAVGARPRPQIAAVAEGGKEPQKEARLGEISATLRIDGRMQEATVPIFERSNLLAGNQLAGPAIVIQDTSTTILNDGDAATIDGLGNIRIAPQGGRK